MKSNVESRVDKFRSELEKFSARWNHAKPTPDVIEAGDKEACLKAVELVKEKKVEFDEVQKTKNSLM